MDMGAHDYWYATEYYEDIWEDVPGDSPVREQEPAEQEPTEQEPATDDFGFMPYIDHNWQERPDEGGESITVTERRLLGTKCPYCQQDFANGQYVAKVSVRARRMPRLL